MTIQHHPGEDLLLAYAGGTLDAGAHVALATHLAACRQCRNLVGDMEAFGGDLVDAAAPLAMQANAFAQIEALLDQPAPLPSPPRPRHGPAIDAPGLPSFVRRLDAGVWRRVAPGVRLQSITPPAHSESRLFLLHSRPGMRMLAHGHSGVELTCVLKGSFNHTGNDYRCGDFDCGDDGGDHAITIGSAEDCLCLVAMTGELQFRGIVGRLAQPFIAI